MCLMFELFCLGLQALINGQLHLAEMLAHGDILADQVRKLLQLIRQIFAEREQYN